MRTHLAVDIGATWTRIALGIDGKIVKKIVFRTPNKGGRSAVADSIIAAFEKELKEYFDKIEAIGVGTIGPLDIKKGVVVNTPNLPLGTFDIRRPLEEYFGKPVYVVNDAVAGVIAEKYYGRGSPFNNIVYVTMSTGIGGGIIVDGRVLLGKNGNAHEIGHIVVKYDSEIKCGCGGYGHWEAYAGGANIPRLAKYIAEKNPWAIQRSGIAASVLRGDVEARDIFEAARRGDILAKMVVDEIVKASIAGFVTVINLYDPEFISIGGSVFLNNKDLLYEPIRKGVLNGIVTEPPIIEPTTLGDDIVLYGALALAMNKIVELS
ncbi:ROK family protein [Thermogladius sp. 4427co]|uniref:ROK family protein n=1 Tax=Thermogladius sp. 4427co TaxID=3450718 RepID=UPI003F7AB8B6